MPEYTMKFYSACGMIVGFAILILTGHPDFVPVGCAVGLIAEGTNFLLWRKTLHA